MKKYTALILIAFAAIGGFLLRDLTPNFYEEWIHSWFPGETAEEEPEAGGHHHHHHHHMAEEGDEGHDDHNLALSDDQIAGMGIATSKASSGSLDFSLATRGKIILHPDKLVHVLPKMTGVAYEARKNIGDAVSQGEVIALIESKEIAGIKAEFLAAAEKERLADSIFEKEKRLHEKQISSEYEYLQAKTALEEAKINLRLAKQKLHAFGLTEEDVCCLAESGTPELRIYEIRSPIDGTVIKRDISIGEFLEETVPIYELADLSEVWVEIGVFPKDLDKVKIGQTAQIKIPGSSLEGSAKIIYVSPIIKEETIASKAIAQLDNSEGNWRPGSFVLVDIGTGTHTSEIVIPREAVQEIEGVPVVFMRTPDGFELRRIQIGKGDEEKVEILAGLFDGEEFASSNTFLLKAELGKSEVEHDD